MKFEGLLVLRREGSFMLEKRCLLTESIQKGNIFVEINFFEVEIVIGYSKSSANLISCDQANERYSFIHSYAKFTEMKRKSVKCSYAKRFARINYER